MKVFINDLDLLYLLIPWIDLLGSTGNSPFSFPANPSGCVSQSVSQSVHGLAFLRQQLNNNTRRRRSSSRKEKELLWKLFVNESSRRRGRIESERKKELFFFFSLLILTTSYYYLEIFAAANIKTQ